MYLKTETSMINGLQYDIYTFITNEEAIDFIKQNDQNRKRYSCFESSGKYFVCYYK